MVSVVRTTVEIADEQRARLVELAARRGERGFSKLVQEALELYLRDREQQDAIEKAQRLKGLLSNDEADELENAVSIVRSRWR